MNFDHYLDRQMHAPDVDPDPPVPPDSEPDPVPPDGAPRPIGDPPDTKPPEHARYRFFSATYGPLHLYASTITQRALGM